MVWFWIFIFLFDSSPPRGWTNFFQCQMHQVVNIPQIHGYKDFQSSIKYEYNTNEILR